MRAVNKVIREVTISLAESIPSARTARLPDRSPMTIFRIDRKVFPTTPTQEALIIIFDLSSMPADVEYKSRKNAYLLIFRLRPS